MTTRRDLMLALIAISIPFSGAAQGRSQNLVQNGSFELNYSYSGWTSPTGTSVDLGGPSAGVQCADGYNAVGLAWQASLYQDIPTTPGQNYDFSFYLADWGFSGVPSNVVSLSISFGAKSLGTDSFSGTGHTYQDMGWQRFDYHVTAISSATRITFVNPGPVGSDTLWPMIDNVVLVSVPEPTTGVLFLMGGFAAFVSCRRIHH